MKCNTYLNRDGSNVLEEFSSDMERVFDSLLGRTVGSVLRGGASEEKFTPALDISESAERFLVHVDLPGVAAEDVSVEMHDGNLSISGTRSSNRAGEDHNYHRIERSSGGFRRVLSLPSEVDVEGIQAVFKLGVLEIVLPKTAKQQPRQIQIRTNEQ